MTTAPIRYRMRKKPEVEVEAKEWSGDRDDDLGITILGGGGVCGYCHQLMELHGRLTGRDTWRIVCPGDWIVTSADGTRYPCRPAVFAAVYEPIVTVIE